MFGGAVGDIVGGVHIFSAIKVDLPTDALTVTDYAPTVSGGASIELPTDSLTVTDYAPAVDLILTLTLPTDDLSIANYVTVANGGASDTLPVDTLSVNEYAPEVTIIIEGVPRFYLNRSGSTVTLTFTNRGSKEVQIFRSDNHNTSFSSLAFTTSDTYSDSVGTNNYKYKCRFVGRVSGTINASGQKSITKFSKN